MFQIFKKDSEQNDLLEKPGDKITAEITPSNRRVVKISKNDGNDKYSCTTYENGTKVETKTTKMK